MIGVIKRHVSLGELKLLGVFVGLNVLDGLLTNLLIGKGYLCLETNLFAEGLLKVCGPPYYQFWLLWLFKIGVTLTFAIGLIVLARVAPRIRRFIFTLPVIVIGMVCLNNLGSLLWLA